MKPEIKDLLNKLGIQDTNFGACVGGNKWLEEEVGQLESISPNDGSLLAKVNLTGSKSYEQIMEASTEAYKTWQMVPAPRRGLLVKAMADALRINKDALGSLVSLEMGKIKAEGDGEVQEMIDIADFAVGLSRQLYGLTMHSERPLHRMYEQWHPLGVVGIISAFNFPVAVWSWNAFLAAICGNISVWKPSPKTPLTAIAVQHICNKVLADEGFKGIFNLIIGSNEAVGEAISNDPRIPLVSFTGSTKVGKHVAQIVHGRLGKTILELGGNNALIN
jgi:aldehyde dehydrogenase (NAD+)